MLVLAIEFSKDKKGAVLPENETEVGQKESKSA